MPLAFYLDFATKQKGLRQAIDSKGLLSPNIVSLFCRPLPPSDNKGKDSAAIKQILHSYFIECTNLESLNAPLVAHRGLNPLIADLIRDLLRIMLSNYIV